MGAVTRGIQRCFCVASSQSYFVWPRLNPSLLVPGCVRELSGCGATFGELSGSSRHLVLLI